MALESCTLMYDGGNSPKAEGIKVSNKYGCHIMARGCPSPPPPPPHIRTPDCFLIMVLLSLALLCVLILLNVS